MKLSRRSTMSPGRRPRAWGKLSVKLTDGLTRIKSRCSLRPSRWSLAFRETWTPAAGRALVWHPLYSRHTPNQRAPFDRGNCGLSPPTGRPTAPRQPRPNPKPAPRPLQPPSRRATSGEPPAAPRVPVCHGRPGQWRPGRGLRDGARAACTHGAGGDFAPAREPILKLRKLSNSLKYGNILPLDASVVSSTLWRLRAERRIGKKGRRPLSFRRP